MQGKLYLCATPIGNLDDITFRVLNTLKEVDLIAAEDTRHSIKLLNHFDIKTPMTSYHEFNKVDKAKYLVERMSERAPQCEYVVPDKMTINFKEALIFAFLGMLYMCDVPNCLASVTGAKFNCVGGALYKGRKR